MTGITRLVLVFSLLSLAACRTAEPAPEVAANDSAMHAHHDANRLPNQVSDASPEETKAFLDFEAKLGQHTFIMMGKKGHFGYHVSQFQSKHQHQVLVKTAMVSPKVKTLKNDAAVIARLAVPPKAKLGPKGEYSFYSVTSNKPPSFDLIKVRYFFDKSEHPIISRYPATIYDGIIGFGGGSAPKETAVDFRIEKVLYHRPMVADEAKPTELSYLVFGTYGAPKKDLFLAHQIKGANNYEQLLNVTFAEPISFVDAAKITIPKRPDGERLAAGQDYDGILNDTTPVKFHVDKEVYYSESKLE